MQPFKQSQTREWPHEGRWWGNPGALSLSGSRLAMEVVAMANIIKFPKAHREHPAAPRPPLHELPMPSPKNGSASVPAGKWRQFFSGLFGGIWLITTALSPFLQWALKYDVVFQLVRMLYYWNTPGMHAGWTFLLHFCALTFLTCCVWQADRF